MKLKIIHLKKFRCFESFGLNLNSTMNIIAGNTKSGKTATLDAILIGISNFFLGLDRHLVQNMQYDDVRIAEAADGIKVNTKAIKCSTVIKCEAEFDDKYINWAREFNAKTGATTQRRQADLKNYSANFLQRIRDFDSTVKLPIIMYYPQTRAVVQKKLPTNIKGFDNRLLGYIDYASNERNIDFVISWLEKMTYVQLQEEKEVPELTAVLKAIAQFATVRGLHDVSARFNIRTRDLEICSTNYDNVQYAYSFNELQDNIKNSIFLIAEIACRMAILNPQLLGDVVKKTNGIVLIDEFNIEHPLYTKEHILSALETIFPSVQFIVTTSSTDICKSCNSSKLIVLDNCSTKSGIAASTKDELANIIREISPSID